MKLYLARHGKTEWNDKDLVLGRTDIPLNEEGKEQAHLLAKKVAEYGIGKIYVSPLVRAIQTARCVSDLTGAEIIIKDCLIEMDYGIYEGVDRHDKEYLKEREKYFKRFLGGESYLDVAARVYPFIEELIKKAQDALVITHGAVCRVINSYFVDCDNEAFSDFRLANCEIVVYENPHAPKIFKP